VWNKNLPFELTSPLPIIEPTFLLVLVAGLLFSFPIGGWIRKQLDHISRDRFAVKFSFQVLYDLWLVFIFLASVASTANTSVQPGIYGTF
jgi:hypothetical protein